MERAETTLLREFRNYARRQELRTRALELPMAEVEQRADDFEQRNPPKS
ncbi:MAG: hypothetical protein HYZ57_10545 [Acidobacteria bacterium]|nr:hypothetical protein [Acidobacteriota bacterium]MBI3280267.1 hypothetical protein [Acidobacteriota bacterium]